MSKAVGKIAPIDRLARCRVATNLRFGVFKVSVKHSKMRYDCMLHLRTCVHIPFGHHEMGIASGMHSLKRVEGAWALFQPIPEFSLTS